MESNDAFVASLSDYEISNFWRFCDSFTIRQAALLIVGIDPESEVGACCEGWKPHERPKGYGAVKQALTACLLDGSIKGKHFFLSETDINGNFIGVISGTTDIEYSTLERDSLTGWLRWRGVRTGFFFPLATDTPDYLDPESPRYAPKLAAAVRAWQAVTDPNGKSPKQAMAKWLREHAAEFGLSDDEGKPNETGIEEVAKVANWQPGGGASKTPGG